jgi:hypothetical protein
MYRHYAAVALRAMLELPALSGAAVVGPVGTRTLSSARWGVVNLVSIAATTTRQAIRGRLTWRNIKVRR